MNTFDTTPTKLRAIADKIEHAAKMHAEEIAAFAADGRPPYELVIMIPGRQRRFRGRSADVYIEYFPAEDPRFLCRKELENARGGE